MSARLPFLAAGTVVKVVNLETSPGERDRAWVVAQRAIVVDDSLMWGQTLIEISGAGRVAVDRRWCSEV